MCKTSAGTFREWRAGNQHQTHSHYIGKLPASKTTQTLVFKYRYIVGYCGRKGLGTGPKLSITVGSTQRWTTQIDLTKADYPYDRGCGGAPNKFSPITTSRPFTLPAHEARETVTLKVTMADRNLHVIGLGIFDAKCGSGVHQPSTGLPPSDFTTSAGTSWSGNVLSVAAGSFSVHTKKSFTRPVDMNVQMRQNGGSPECGTVALFPTAGTRHSGYNAGLGGWGNGFFVGAPSPVKAATFVHGSTWHTVRSRARLCVGAFNVDLGGAQIPITWWPFKPPGPWWGQPIVTPTHSSCYCSATAVTAPRHKSRPRSGRRCGSMRPPTAWSTITWTGASSRL